MKPKRQQQYTQGLTSRRSKVAERKYERLIERMRPCARQFVWRWRDQDEQNAHDGNDGHHCDP
jgi:hypothetical protein